MSEEKKPEAAEAAATEAAAPLAAAVLAVMAEVKGVEKSMNVGTGGSSYKGVSDRDVKIAIGRAMQRHGLVILPVAVEDSVTTDRWQETNQYGTKTKQQTTVSVKTKYKLIHAPSGECEILAGYGHGTDSQDKAAGKATTYALKYALLYTFLVPTGDIDDTDNDHSDDKDVPPVGKTAAPPADGPRPPKPAAKTQAAPPAAGGEWGW